MTAELYPFDPKSTARSWTPQAFGISELPVFDPAPVGNHKNIATCSLLYRFFDEGRQPLYIGVTTVPANRWQSHRRSAWWGLSRFVSLEAVPPGERLEHERRAIKDERPRFNVLRPDQPIRARIRLDYPPALIIGQLRELMTTQNFAALAAAFAAQIEP